MLETFTVDTFKPRVGEQFRVIVDETWEMRTVLTDASPWGTYNSAKTKRAPFSLTFIAPRDAVIPQQIYRVENENMEAFDCFLVPTGPEGDGMGYQAIFT
jgi:hypothetical protein